MVSRPELEYFPDLGAVSGIIVIFFIPLSEQINLPHSSPTFSPPLFFFLLYLACLPSSHKSIKGGGRDLEMKLEWAHSSPLVTLPCVFLKILMLALTVRSRARGLCGTCSVLSNLTCLESLCLLRPSESERAWFMVRRAPGLSRVPGTGVFFCRKCG